MEISSDLLRELVFPRLQKAQSVGLTADFIATFTKAQLGTVQAWISGTQPTGGERLIRLWHLLNEAGIDSPEFSNMPAFNRYIGELFAFSLLTKQEVLDICKQNYNDGAIRTMRGVPPMHQQYDLQQLKELYDESLTAARKQFQESLPSVTTAARTTELPPPVAPVRVVPSAHPKAVPQHVSQPAVPLLTDNPVLTLATLLSAAVPLARHLSSDTCTSEQRSQLRDLMGERGMFDLSNEINALCSERARSMRK